MFKTLDCGETDAWAATDAIIQAACQNPVADVKFKIIKPDQTFSTVSTDNLGSATVAEDPAAYTAVITVPTSFNHAVSDCTGIDSNGTAFDAGGRFQLDFTHGQLNLTINNPGDTITCQYPPR